MITNFKPILLNDFSRLNFFKKKTPQIYCKNFFLYILLLKYKNNLFNGNNIFIKKNKRKVFTILRSPYRHKLARHQISLNRYFISISIKINIKKPIVIKNWKKCIIFLNFLKKFNNTFESNLIFISSFSFLFPAIYKNNFCINNKKF